MVLQEKVWRPPSKRMTLHFWFVLQNVGWLEKDRNNLADDLHMGMLEQQHNKVRELTAIILQQIS